MRWISNLFCLTTIVFGLIGPEALFAGGVSERCATQGPVILAHGTGGAEKILGIVDYWWGIPEALENEGAEVYITTVNGLDGTIDKAEAFRKEFLEILAMYPPKTQFNIIGHSHGALYTRYAISNLGLAPHVKSCTSIAGPHHGMVLADLLIQGIPGPIPQFTGKTLDFVSAYFLNDTDPDTLDNVLDVRPAYMENVFNPNTPNQPGVDYQSWAAQVDRFCPNLILDPVWRLLLVHEGPNDGLVGVESAKWGDFQGTESGAWWSPGCDHLSIIGHLFGVTPGFSAPDFYVDLVSRLKDKGY